MLAAAQYALSHYLLRKIDGLSCWRGHAAQIEPQEDIPELPQQPDHALQKPAQRPEVENGPHQAGARRYFQRAVYGNRRMARRIGHRKGAFCLLRHDPGTNTEDATDPVQGAALLQKRRLGVFCAREAQIRQAYRYRTY